MAFPENDFKEAAELDKLEPLSGYEDALHQNQKDDLSGEKPGEVKKFFDYMALHVLIPCINALNRAVLALKGNTSTSLEKLEKKLTDLSGNTTTSVKVLEERVDSVEKVSAVSTAKVEAATELAKAAAENVMKKDQVASVLDVVKKTPLYFGSGTDEEIEAAILVAPGTTAYFDETDTSWEDLVAEVAGKTPGGLVAGFVYANNDDELDAELGRVYKSLPENSILNIVVVDETGLTSLSGGNTHVTIYKTNDKYGCLEAVHYGFKISSKKTRSIWDGVWQPWSVMNPELYVGVEYLTTELYNGFNDYIKVVDFGYLPNNSFGSIDLKIPYDDILSYEIIATTSRGGATHLPYFNEYGGILARAYCEGERLVIQTFGDMSSYTAVCKIKYKKGE